MLIKDAGFNDWALQDDASSKITYYGYPKFGQTTENPKCAIMRVQTTGHVTIRKWAGGTQKRDYNWNDRASLTYKFLQ